MESKLQLVEYNEALGLRSDEDLVDAFNVMADRFKDLKITDTKTDKAVHSARAKVVSKRTAVEERRLALNAAEREKVKATIENNNKNAAFIQDLIARIEEPLQIECKRWDEEKARIKAEKERKEKERVDGIRYSINKIAFMLNAAANKDSKGIQEISDTLESIEITTQWYAEFVEEAQRTADDVYAKLQDMIITAQRREKEDAERLAEAERLEKIRKEQEKAQSKIDEENRRIQAERASLEAESRAIAQREREREIARLAAERAKKEEQERLEREAQAKINREASEKAEAERREALKPDLEKVKDYTERLLSTWEPELSNKKAEGLLLNFFTEMKHACKSLIKDMEAL